MAVMQAWLKWSLHLKGKSTLILRYSQWERGKLSHHCQWPQWMWCTGHLGMLNAGAPFGGSARGQTPGPLATSWPGPRLQRTWKQVGERQGESRAGFQRVGAEVASPKSSPNLLSPITSRWVEKLL